MKDEERAERARKRWAEMTLVERLAMREKIREAMKQYWAKKSEEQRREIGRNVSAGKREASRAKKS